MRRLAAAIAIAVWSLAPAAGQKPPETWQIRGELSEACTCQPPCSCNFGERPSPHDYCYAMWSYWVREGRFREVDLADLHIGGVEGAGGMLGLLDARAAPPQRQAMEEIWHDLSGRLLCMVRLWPLKAVPGAASDGRQGAVTRTRYADRKFLGFDYLAIEQEIRDRGVKLTFGDRGGFEAAYLYGRDRSKPITVTNIVSWPIEVSIKGKTLFLRYKDRYNQLDYQGTNSNQGRFELSSTQAGARPMTAPR